MIKKQGRNVLCSCGSQLKYKYCCGRQLSINNYTRKAPSFQDVFEQGWQFHQRGYLSQALNIYLGLIEQRPSNTKILYLIGAIYRAEGQLDLAWQYIHKSIKKGFVDPAAIVQYCELLVERKQFNEAIKHLEKLLKKQAYFFEAVRLAANIYFELGKYSDAERWYNKALLLNQTDDTVHHNLAKTLLKRNNNDDAIAYFTKAVDINPSRIENLISLSNALEQNNQLDKAEHYVRLALELEPSQFSALLVLSKLLFRRNAYTLALEKLDEINIVSISEGERVELLNQKALIFEKLGEFSSAIESQSESNNYLSGLRKVSFELPQFIERLESVERSVDQIDWILMPTQNSFKPLPILPIFVVGFFRSGTTLVHQILSSHPDIVGAGELNFVQRLKIQLETDFGNKYLQSLAAMPVLKRNKYISKLRSQYLVMIKELAHNYGKERATFIVDKFPFNLLELPLIKLLFPEAPIIHMLRRPLDTVLSCFFTIFQDDYSWSDDFVDAANVYLAQHHHATIIKKLTGHTLHELKYEELVIRFEENTRLLLSLVGVSWNDSCLNFHLNKNIPSTPSYGQVTKKIYTSSLYRGNQYKNLIPADARAILDNIGLELGY